MLLLGELHHITQERGTVQGRAHIPFRNSMLTTALRDSLGGNCRTVMVANVAATPDQAEETISTCRFAQRVAMISNTVEQTIPLHFNGNYIRDDCIIKGHLHATSRHARPCTTIVKAVLSCKHQSIHCTFLYFVHDLTPWAAGDGK